MTQLARLAVALLVTIVATWSVMQMAGATTMSLEMASAASDGGMDMPGCDGCDSDRTDLKGHALCHSICTSVVLAELSAPQDLEAMPPLVIHVAVPVHIPAGQTFPPDLHPPRALPLI